MKLDELMAGLEDFLNAPPAKRQKVEIYFSHFVNSVIKIDLNFSDEPQAEENEEVSDSDITDASESEESSSESE